MSTQIGFKNRFNSGELSEAAQANSDLQQHANGVALGRNYIGLPLGPLARRTGTYWAGETRYANRVSRPIPFVRSVDDAVMLEFGHLHFRVRRTDGSLVTEGALVVEIASPFSADDLAGLRWRQSNDMMLFFHRDGRHPWRLLRLASDSVGWDFSPYQFDNGPWRAENTDETWTLTAGAIKGTGVSLTSSQALFQPAMVGTQFRLRAAAGTPGLKTWMADWDPVDNEMVNSNGRIYRNADAPASTVKTGNTPPIHDRGTVSDGVLHWEYVHDGAGVIEVTDVVSEFSAVGTVLRTLPTTGDATHKMPAGFNDALPPTSLWAESAFNDYRGWPTAWPEFREERLVVGGNRSEPDKFDCSRTAGFNTARADFTPGLGTGRVVDDDAIRNFCGDVSAQVTWFASRARLLAATHATENVIGGGTLDDPLTPSARARSQTEYGAGEAAPARAGDALLYITRGGGLREWIVAADLATGGSDLALAADHIADRGLVDLAWTGDPNNLLWVMLADGDPASFTYHREQRVYGWNSHELAGGWKVEGLASLPAPGGRDALWLHVVRTKDGSPQRGVLILADRRDGMFYDAAERYQGAAVNAVAGLDHLTGETVSAKARNGTGPWAEYRGLTVDGGVVTLPNGAEFEEIMVGLPYRSRFESLPSDLQGPGTTQARKQRVVQMKVIARGVEGRAGVMIDGEDRKLDRFAARTADETGGPVERRLVVNVPCDGGTSEDPRLVVECDGGWDLVIYALKPKEVVND